MLFRQPTMHPTTYVNNIKRIENLYIGGWREYILSNDIVNIIATACTSRTNYVAVGNQGANTQVVLSIIILIILSIIIIILSIIILMFF